MTARRFPSLRTWRVLRQRAQRQADEPSHGLSVFGDLKYGPDFHAFRLRQSGCPQGRHLHLSRRHIGIYNQNSLTFNTFNSFILKGDAPPRMELCFDTLMVRAYDEPDAMYGLLAETVEISEDGNTYFFNLRPEAKFHDGSKLTAEDVAFSLDASQGRRAPADQSEHPGTSGCGSLG